MTYIIRGREEKTGFYTGSGWDQDKAKAKRYPTKDAAINIITKHNMPAAVDEADDTADEPAAKPEKESGEGE